MPDITLTTFVDFVSATGTARLTKVRQAKKFYEEGYAPARDFYKPLRDRIEACFEGGWNSAGLRKALGEVDDPKKAANYEECRKGLTKWVGRKQISTLNESRGTWSAGRLNVSVNPELHLEINGVPHLLKLYLKGEALSKQRANAALHLVGGIAGDSIPGVLDVRRSKLYVPTVPIPGMDALLKAEAAALTTLWASL
jgi:hypothetical protein